MHIIINDTTILKDIQDTFSDYYPYLQLQFYNQPHTKYALSDESGLFNIDKTIGEVKKTHVSGLLEIRPLDTIADVEREFGLRFGLSVQVLQKEKDKWVQTAGTDNFTLKELNELSRNASDEFIVEDYDEGFEENR